MWAYFSKIKFSILEKKYDEANITYSVSICGGKNYLILQVVNETCDCCITLDEDIHVWALLDKIIRSFYFVSVVCTLVILGSLFAYSVISYLLKLTFPSVFGPLIEELGSGA